MMVGIDGSDPSRAALRSAEAKRRGAELYVVLAYRWRWPGMHLDSGGELASTTRQQAGGPCCVFRSGAHKQAKGMTTRGDLERFNQLTSVANGLCRHPARRMRLSTPEFVAKGGE